MHENRYKSSLSFWIHAFFIIIITANNFIYYLKLKNSDCNLKLARRKISKNFIPYTNISRDILPILHLKPLYVVAVEASIRSALELNIAKLWDLINPSNRL